MRRGLARAAIGIAVFTAVATALVHRAANARVAELAAWAKTAEARWAAQDCTREAFAGATVDGSAFAHYRDAVERTQGLAKKSSDRLRDLRTQPDKVPPAEAAALLEQYAPALAEMHAGAHSKDARPDVDWRAGFAHRVLNLLVARDLVNAAMLSSRQLRANGNDLAAVELMLDAATFGSDLMQSPILIDQMIGAALTTIATSEAWDDASLRSLSPNALQTLADGLARLDAHCPANVDFVGESLLFANAVQQFPPTYEAMPPAWQAWRYGFSMRLAAAEAVLFEAQMSAELAAMATLPWPQREQRMREMLDRPVVQQNPMLAIALPNLTSAERTLREALTQVRLLRCAVAWRLGDRQLQLIDPLGSGMLQVQQEGAAVHFVSAGKRCEKAVERVVAAE